MARVANWWFGGLGVVVLAAGCDATDASPEGDGAVAVGDSGADGSAAEDAGGSRDAGADASDADLEIEVVFEARVADALFACDATYTGLGTTGAEASPLDFRLYVHDVRLIDAEGGERPLELAASDFVHANVTLLDFEDNTGTCTNGNSATNDRVVGTVPAGEYVGLAFGVGVPAELNHEDPAAAASPLDLTALHWNWAAGYKFVRMDFLVTTADGGAGAPFNFHLGSTLCQGDPAMGDEVSCDHPNRPEVALEEFDVATQKVVIDYAALVANEDLDEDMGGAPGCMSGGMDGDCTSVFAQLGLDLATGEGAGEQQVFSAEAR